MNPKQILGLVALAAGVILLIYACNEAETYREQASQMVRGHYTQNTMWAYILGTVLTVLGIGGAVYFRKK